MNAPRCRPRALWSAASLLLCFAACHGLVTAQQPTDTARAPADYVVHEWGTFTSMVGTDGVVLEGLQHEEEHLPAFVHDLLSIEETGVSKTKLPASHVTQKMETPVIYFHADKPLQARVTVHFQDGLMTQFYPLPTTVSPQLDEARQQRVDLRGFHWSSLCWDIDIVPRTQQAPTEIPPVDADEPWSFARQTSACYVRTRPLPDSPARAEAEHYLFYRGIGRWQPAVAAEVGRRGALRLANRMQDPIPFCVALELGAAGGRFVLGQPIAGGGEQAFDLGAAAWTADREAFARRVGADVLRALVQQGLHLDEARAMVATWSRSWFESDGARVVYVLPRSAVDQVLPLRLEPEPKALVRVLVGRHECITPEAQERVEQALRDHDAPDAARRVRGETALAGLDRFLEPHLRNVVRNGSSEAVRRTAEAVLASLPR